MHNASPDQANDLPVPEDGAGTPDPPPAEEQCEEVPVLVGTSMTIAYGTK